MPNINVLNKQGKSVDKVDLSDYVFGIEPHQQAIFDVVHAQRAAMRQGTHAVKDRSEVSGGGRKPWKQKGTGRARQGSIRSPQWRGGGVVFGPTPRSYRVKLNQKVRQLALRSALSYHLKNNTLVVIDAFELAEAKTKTFKDILTALQVVNKKVLCVSKQFTENDALSARNLPLVQFSNANHVSVYDVLNAKTLVVTKEAALALQEVLDHE
jgi:large subunit ribosomal protein L4